MRQSIFNQITTEIIQLHIVCTYMYTTSNI